MLEKYFFKFVGLLLVEEDAKIRGMGDSRVSQEVVGYVKE